MSFDSTTATPEQLTARLQKFKRKAPQMNPDHFTRALNSFPEEHRDAVVLAVKEEGPTDFFRDQKPIELVYVRPDPVAVTLEQINDTLQQLKETQQ